MRSSDDGGSEGRDSGHVGTLDFFSLRFSILDDLDGGHARDTVLLGSGAEIVNIDVDADQLTGVFVGKCLHVAGDALAGTAPFSGELEEDGEAGSGGHDSFKSSVVSGVLHFWLVGFIIDKL